MNTLQEPTSGPPARSFLQSPTFWIMFGIVVFLVLFWFMVVRPVILQPLRARREAEWLSEHGRAGTAVVLSLSDTGVTINDNPQVRLRLAVRSGDAEFEAELVTVVSRLDVARLQPGSTVEVRFDPANRSRITVVGLD